MLGLAQHVGRRVDRIRRLVGDDEDLARPCEHVDVDMAVDLFLGQRDEDVARTRDLVDARDGLRAEGHRSDGLSAADLVDFLDAGRTRGDEDVGIDFAVLRRYHHDDLTDTSDRGRHSVHDDG